MNMIHGIYLLEIKHDGKEAKEYAQEASENARKILHLMENKPGKYLLGFPHAWLMTCQAF